MKLIKISTVALFALLLILPVLFFNFEEPAVSEIDNRTLAANPFTQEGDLTNNIDSYISDRIGFRNEMILGYTVLNDRLFGKMVHPNYIYGQDGYVFGAGLYTHSPYGAYHETFADMVLEIQNYCQERDIPFLFVLNPAKPAVLAEYLPEGRRQDRSWVDAFLEALDARGIRYVDNTQTLIAQKEAGEVVFNQKYDANHWNDLGAYYGVRAMLEELQKDYPGIYVREKTELNIGWKVETSLPVSQFPINEKVPQITLDTQYQYYGGQYAGELMLHPSYTAFLHYENPQRKAEGAPKALVFQGSYMNGYGNKYLIDGLGEYIAVHDYQNVMEFDYYVNIFQPDCVIFEVAEYTFSDTYFDSGKMSAMDLNPTLAQAEALAAETLTGEAVEVTVTRGNALTVITWAGGQDAQYAWLTMDGELDMRVGEGIWEVTVTNASYDVFQGELSITTMKEDVLTRYSVK